MDKDMHGLWKLTRALNNPTRSNTVIEVNHQLSTEKMAASAFADLYKEESTIQVRKETVDILLSQPSGNDNTMTDPFSTKELKHAVRKLKSRKAPRPDGIWRNAEASWSSL